MKTLILIMALSLILVGCDGDSREKNDKAKKGNRVKYNRF